MADLDTLLEALQNKDPKLIASLRKAMAPHRTRVNNPLAAVTPVTVYTQVIKHVTCIHCDSKYDVSYNLIPGEGLSYVENGSPKSMVVKHSKDPIEINAHTTWCEKCPAYIKTLGRQDMEQRYMALLQMTGCARLEQMAKLRKEKKSDERRAGSESAHCEERRESSGSAGGDYCI